MEIAKHCEHVTRDFAAARAACERALALIERHHARMGYGRFAAEHEALMQRLARLEARLRSVAAPARRKRG
jgi:DNA-binding FrmR family transcriptional regulator